MDGATHFFSPHYVLEDEWAQFYPDHTHDGKKITHQLTGSSIRVNLEAGIIVS